MREQNRKLVTTESRKRCVFGKLAFQNFSDFNQYRVTGDVSCLIVDQLESIQVKSDQCYVIYVVFNSFIEGGLQM